MYFDNVAGSCEDLFQHIPALKSAPGTHGPGTLQACARAPRAHAPCAGAGRPGRSRSRAGLANARHAQGVPGFLVFGGVFSNKPIATEAHVKHWPMDEIATVYWFQGT